MNLLTRNNPDVVFAPHEKFFLETWHGMTHELSLDSYRVRCLNARMIIRELDQELRIGRASPEELQDLCAEAEEILGRDPLVPQSFGRHLGLLLSFLKNPSLPDEKKRDAAPDPKQREFRFIVADFSAALERDYFRQLLAALPDTITGGDNDRTYAAVGTLLSDLVDQGWPLESLFGWLDLFFQKKPLTHHATFSANLLFLMRQLDRGKQPFRAILRLSGSSNLSTLGDFAGFQFRPLPGFTALPGPQKKFAIAYSLVTFAETQVEAVDFISAAIAAREKFELCLDQMRFNFEPSPLKVDQRCFVERSDQRTDLVTVRHLVPNPRHHLAPEAFREFTGQMESMLKRENIEAETAERLRAAVRHYRFGSDADSYKDKFLNWWMGLEFLTHVTQGEMIGRTVSRHVSDALLQRYLYRLVWDLVHTLQDHSTPWPADLATESETATLAELKASGAVKLLRSQPHAEKLALSFPDNPVAAFHIRRLSAVLQDPKKTADLIATHHRHVLWQLGRLYRIRCCIVHGSPIRFKLPLLTANLEFYLRELILVCLWSLSLNEHVSSLREVFQRAAVARQRLDSELRDNNPSPDAIRRAVFNAVVIQENP
ncbi:MAG: hypothetical protein HY360_03235 [Verrucomicrobia bacterium]|nr:hypothetical protein [Verrucomicrobiota bacterium]